VVKAVEPLGRRDNKSPGQALEFEIWSDLIKQSHGALHVFLPLVDRGLDAVLHRMTDRQYIPVQIKGRSRMVAGQVKLVVQAESLVDDDALIIASLIFDLGGQVDLVVSERIFKQLAARVTTEDHDVYVTSFSMHPVHTRWRPYLVPRSELAATILGMPTAQAKDQIIPLLPPSERHNDWLGFLGESEVIRRLAESPRLDLFRPFPDLEMVEVLARNNVTRQFAGIQVKTATVAEIYHEAHIHIRKPTLNLAATTWLVGLAWRHEKSAFDAECLIIPAADIPRVAIDKGPDFVINFHPDSPQRTRLDPYRRPLAELGQLIERYAEV
jgi:hypothetical protein